ncbi:aminoglycoside phosphotransferase family protein [Bacillus sp. CGMCC 1.16607]|uniref:aminoglycoside phosphotransferase family protein n=1 Tax=Bacillus sp. CGMCC 1.16607 TaxID=3351842 RepID=UPI003643B266
MIQLTETYVNNILFIHKEKGEEWLNQLDQLISYCEQRWSIHVQNPFDLSFNFVAPAIQCDGTEIVLKLSIPSDDYYHELEALKYFNQHQRNFVQLLDFDKERGIILLERLQPGEMLASLAEDEEATRIAAKVMKKLWTPVPEGSNFPTTRDREDHLLDMIKTNPYGIGPVSMSLLEEASEIFKRANDTSKGNYLLHGDLHHYNILSSEKNSWMVIDPKGLIGEREYDLIQFLMNKLPDFDNEKRIELRINIFVEELGLNKERILLWGVCHSILSTAWSVNDEGEYDYKFFQSIQVFRKLYKKMLDNKPNIK